MYRKIKTQKFVAYLHFFLNLVLVPEELSLIFLMDNIFVCSIPRYTGECLSAIKELHMVSLKTFENFARKLHMKKSGTNYQEIALNLPLQMRNQATSASQSLDDFFYHFEDIGLQ